jgi:hypothetical protein
MSDHYPPPWKVLGDDRNTWIETENQDQICVMTLPDNEANADFIVLAVNAHEKLLEAVKMVFEAADEASSQELGQNIDWDMLRDAYNLGLKGEA